MSIFEKNNDFSYKDVKYKLDKKDLNIVLCTLIDKYLNIERANKNRSHMGWKLIDNKYIPYLKGYCTQNNIDDSLVLNHYLYRCSCFSRDYFNLYNPVKYTDKFMDLYKISDPLPVPDNIYFGRNWFILKPDDSPSEYRDNVIVYDKFTIKKGHSYTSSINVRDKSSPCPGVVLGYPFHIDLKSYSYNDDTYVCRFNSYLDGHVFKSIYKKHGIKIPSDTKESVIEWMNKLRDIFTNEILNNGFSYI